MGNMPSCLLPSELWLSEDALVTKTKVTYFSDTQRSVSTHLAETGADWYPFELHGYLFRVPGTMHSY